jgi:hypothetical protein
LRMNENKRKASPPRAITRSVRRRLDEQDRDRSGRLLKGFPRYLLAMVLDWIVDNKKGPFPFMGVCRQFRDHIAGMTPEEVTLKHWKLKHDTSALHAHPEKVDTASVYSRSIAGLPALCNLRVLHIFGREVTRNWNNPMFGQITLLSLCGLGTNVTYDMSGCTPLPNLRFLRLIGCTAIVPGLCATFPSLKGLYLDRIVLDGSKVTIDKRLEKLILAVDYSHTFMTVTGDASFQLIQIRPLDPHEPDTLCSLAPSTIRAASVLVGLMPFSFKFLRSLGIVSPTVEWACHDPRPFFTSDAPATEEERNMRIVLLVERNWPSMYCYVQPVPVLERHQKQLWIASFRHGQSRDPHPVDITRCWSYPLDCPLGDVPLCIAGYKIPQIVRQQLDRQT